MSDDETLTVDGSDSRMLTAEYKDGQLQIVEVTPYERNKDDSILPDDGDQSEPQKYMQVLNGDKGLVQLDLLNLTLVRCEDGQESYRLVTNAETDGTDLSSDGTVTCVLQTSDVEGVDDDDKQESYMMMEGGSGSLVFVHTPRSSVTSLAHSDTQLEVEIEPAHTTSHTTPPAQTKPNPLTPAQILQKAKALQRAKAIIASQSVRRGKRGRRAGGTGQLPPAHELLASPNFKLYLYSCKLCPYKCNAVKDLQAHRAAEHGSSGGKSRGGGGGGGRGALVGRNMVTLQMQCAKCPYRGGNHSQLMKHIQLNHLEENVPNKVSLDSKEVEEADVLVCGACGYESSDRELFRQHIETEHGATTV